MQQLELAGGVDQEAAGRTLRLQAFMLAATQLDAPQNPHGLYKQLGVENEFASTCGFLDPGHPGTKSVISRISGVINRISPHRCLAPDRQVWHQAGILTGIIARAQRIAKPDRRRILNDALIFATARKYGHTVLTRNTTDFDFLQQLDPSGKVVFYKIGQPVNLAKGLVSLRHMQNG